jgi:hypothetical protein
MPDTYRQALASVLDRINSIAAEVEAIQGEPVPADVGSKAEELREVLEELRSRVDGYLAQFN